MRKKRSKIGKHSFPWNGYPQLFLYLTARDIGLSAAGQLSKSGDNVRRLVQDPDR
jgi:hypothetical protein